MYTSITIVNKLLLTIMLLFIFSYILI